MKNMLIRDCLESDYQAIVDMNAAEVQHTSPMDTQRLNDLCQLSSYHKVADVGGSVAAFLIAMRENCPYQNENYAWFSSRYAQFLYIDRIVVDAKYSGLKIGTLLYQDLFDYARSHAIPVITCEYNSLPPNEPSRLFHEKAGFIEVGTQWVAGGQKRVSLQAAQI